MYLMSIVILDENQKPVTVGFVYLEEGRLSVGFEFFSGQAVFEAALRFLKESVGNDFDFGFDFVPLGSLVWETDKIRVYSDFVISYWRRRDLGFLKRKIFVSSEVFKLCFGEDYFLLGSTCVIGSTRGAAFTYLDESDRTVTSYVITEDEISKRIFNFFGKEGLDENFEVMIVPRGDMIVTNGSITSYSNFDCRCFVNDEMFLD
jgi:hypothetical protein